MSTTEVRGDGAKGGASTGRADMKLEVVVIPVADVDRAAEFYPRGSGGGSTRISSGDGFRLVQFTPPGSRCSIISASASLRLLPAPRSSATSSSPTSRQRAKSSSATAWRRARSSTTRGVVTTASTPRCGRAAPIRNGAPTHRSRSSRSGRQRLASSGDHRTGCRAASTRRDHVQLRSGSRERAASVRRPLTASTRSARASRCEVAGLVCRVHGGGAVGHGAAVVVTRPCGLGVQVGSCAHDDRGRCLSHAKRGGARTNSACS